MRSEHSSKPVRPAFTLVELLVVIAIIAILIAVLLPVLQSVKRRAQSVACASNARQLYIAMAMFATDRKGRLPGTYGVGQMSSDPQLVKTAAWLQKVGGASGHADMDDNKGALWQYIKGKSAREKVLMCAGDEGEPLAGHPRNPLYPRNFSYSFNSRISRPANAGLSIEMSSVKQGSTKILIYEELAPNDTWCIMAQSSDDVPSGRHGTNMKDTYRINPNTPEYKSKGRGNHVFFDGHVESLAPGALLPPRPRGNPFYHGPLLESDGMNIGGFGPPF